ncbi:hypothetical protein DIPPA_26009 [Diplonema papillatum]|nr:hypothetical protein DIPPA_26009 [Diplonema papillatum]
MAQADWWHGKPLPASTTIRINNEETPLRDVCDNLTYAAAGEEGSTAPPDVLPRVAGEAAGKTLLFDDDYLPSLSLDRPAPASSRVVYSGAAPARSADSYFISMVAGIFFLAFVRHNIRRKGGLAR